MTSRIMHLLLPLQPQKFQPFCSIEIGLNCYFCASLWNLKVDGGAIGHHIKSYQFHGNIN